MTGWPPGLLQDDCKKLHEWFASRIDARWVVRNVCRDIKRNREMSDLKATTSLYDITGDIKDINTMLVPLQLLQAAEKDAARYRYLRESNCVTGKGVGSSVKSGWFVNLSYESLDAAIDAAMKEQK